LQLFFSRILFHKKKVYIRSISPVILKGVSGLLRSASLQNGDPEKGKFFYLSHPASIHVLTICSMEKVVWISGIGLPKKRVTELVPRSN
jgi:hypothetical protein